MSEPLATGGHVASGDTWHDGRVSELLGRPRFATSGWIGWRLRALLICALLGCIGVFALSTWLSRMPSLAVGSWEAADDGSVVLARTDREALREQVMQAVLAIRSGDRVSDVDASVLQHSSRWIPDDAVAREHERRLGELAGLQAAPDATLQFANGRSAPIGVRMGGFGALGMTYWLLSGMALLLFLVAVVTVTSRPTVRNGLYALMAVGQALQLLLIAVDSTPGLAPPSGLVPWDRPLRMAIDLSLAAALIHAAVLHPTPLPHRRAIAALTWLVAGVLGIAIASDRLPHAWALTQTATLGGGLIAVALFGWSHRSTPHPFAMLLRRFAMLSTCALAVLTLCLALSGNMPDLQRAIAMVGPVVFHVLVGTLLLLLPFLARSQQLVREFALLASVSTVATALDLVFVAVFSIGQVASLTLTLFLALGVYAGARQWLMNRVLGGSVVTTERMFERLYRMARAVEARPHDVVKELSRLLRDLFEPLELVVVNQPLAHARVAGQGSTLLVPVPDLESDPQGVNLASQTILVRFARRGRRLFNADDARLGDRIVEQLRRAVAFDKAVEQGRSEERTRIAQDLHDDIGARLLTLMYKAQSPEMEDYVRHTLQDLKTLTRGLAASSHSLSEAAAEWKADLGHRLGLAHIDLTWSLELQDDVALSVVQWSGLTRVLRELVNNVIAHARARHVQIKLSYSNEHLELRVADDGSGREPQRWSHGLGLGGVRKRVKQLGGEVEWTEIEPAGIACRVLIRDFSRRH